MTNVHGVEHFVSGIIPAIIWHDFIAEAVKDVPPFPLARPGPLPSVATQEARARQAEEQRREERGGLDPGDPQNPEDLSPAGPWWTPAPAPHATAPEQPAPPAGPAPPP